MPRETLLTNMSNDPGAADNDFARPVSEGEAKGRERRIKKEGGGGRMNCDAKLTQTSFVAPPASERASDLGQLIRLGSFCAAAGGSLAVLDLARDILAAVSESEPNYRSL